MSLEFQLLGCQIESQDSSFGVSGSYSNLSEYSRNHSGKALIVMQGDETVFEEGENGGSLDAVYPILSGTKSFNCALVIAAIQDGLISSFDELVSATISEWASYLQSRRCLLR